MALKKSRNKQVSLLVNLAIISQNPLQEHFRQDSGLALPFREIISSHSTYVYSFLGDVLR